MRPMILTLLILTLAACGDKPSPWDQFQTAQATPGQGLGDLRIGSERLGQFADQFGIARVATSHSDFEIGIELFYPREGLHFLFETNAECYRAIQFEASQIARELMTQPETFFQKYPTCRDARLHEIAIIGSTDPQKSWWQGQTSQGSRLGDSWPDAMGAHGTPQNYDRAYLPQRPNENLESLSYDSGMELYFGPAPTGPEDEINRLDMKLRHIRIQTQWVP